MNTQASNNSADARSPLHLPIYRQSPGPARPRPAPAVAGARPAARLLGWLMLLTSAGPAFAQAPSTTTTSVYTCRDAAGRMLTSDRPIPECSNRPMRELSNSGTLKREIDAPLTAEQVRKRREAEQKAVIDAEQRRLTEARDRALLITYRSTDALEASRRRQVSELQRDIGVVESRMSATHRDLVVARADLSKAAAQDASAARRRLDDVTRVLESDRVLLEKLRNDEARINRKFDEDTKRLRVLLGEPEAPVVQQVAADPAAPPTLKPSKTP